MAIDTYLNLQKAVVDHLDRDGLTRYGVARFLPDLVKMAEAVLNFGMFAPGYEIEPLRVRDMETISSLTPVSGVATLPSSYLEARRVVEKASIRRPLSYITPETVDHYYPARESGLSNHYTIIGSSLYMYPVSTNDIEVHHYRTIPPLEANDPNWLLTKNPSVYLRSVLMQAALFVKDDAEALKHGMMLKALVAGMNASDARATIVGGGVALLGPTP